ncbi:MAG: hypothetical protein H0T84_02605 [Tatlockia sp.]|nr:hypothetical protein [Tatlockia sp.]
MEETKISLEDLKQSFQIQLADIRHKGKILGQKGHTDAAAAAEKLYKKLSGSYADTLPHNVELFKTECKAAIEESRYELESHREWKLVLSYLALTVTGIGVLVVLADVGHKLFTGKHFSFFQTDTAKQVSLLEETVDQVPDSPKILI